MKMGNQRCMARKGFDIGEVWNPVCCHGKKAVEHI